MIRKNTEKVNLQSQITYGKKNHKTTSIIESEFSNSQSTSHQFDRNLKTRPWLYRSFKFTEVKDYKTINFDRTHDFLIEKIAIDAEWTEKISKVYEKCCGKIPEYVVKQACIVTNYGKVLIVLWNGDLPDIDPLVLSEIVDIPLIFYRGDIQNLTILDVVFTLGWRFAEKVPVFMFFAPPDLQVLLTREKYYECLVNDTITKKRNINGRIPLKDCYESIEYEKVILDNINFEADLLASAIGDPNELKTHFILFDIYGAFNASLDKAFDSLGMNMVYKNLVPSEWKGRIKEFGMRSPVDLFKYSVGDVVDMPDLWEEKIKMTNSIVSKSLGYNPGFETLTMPRTQGSLVSKVFMKWMRHKHPDLLIAVEALAVTTTSQANVHQRFLDYLECESHDLSKGFIDLPKRKYDGVRRIDGDVLHKEWDGFKKGGISGMARASIGALGGLSDTNAAKLAVVFGGRCRNECPTDFQAENIFDVDLASCYGTSLVDTIFPIGRPRIIASDERVKGSKITFEEFIENYLENPKIGVVDGLWEVMLENPIDEEGNPILFDFEQDLVYSKLKITVESIKRDLRVNRDDEDGGSDIETIVEKEHINGVFKLLKREFRNAIITTHTLKVLKAVCSTKEWSQIKKCKVVCGAYYCKQDEVTPEEFTRVMRDRELRGGYTVPKNNPGNLSDERSYAWCRVPLDDFVGSFLTYRKKLKNLSKSDDVEPDLRHKYNLVQNNVKLFINTLYGCLASPYFPIGNAILANNITDKARVGAWMIGKALALLQAITDGGAYSNDSVRYLKSHLKNFYKPSLHTLSDFDRLNKCKSVGTKKLIPDFDNFYERAKNDLKQVHKELDAIATTHVNEFWSHYNLSLPFDIEHKEDNTARRMIYTNASDYLLIDPLKPSYKLSINDGVISEMYETAKFDRVCQSKDSDTVLSYNIKVRGARAIDHVKKLWLFYLGGYINLPNVNFQATSLLGVNEYKQAMKWRVPPDWLADLLPGYEMIRSSELKPSSNHFPVDSEAEYKHLDLSHAYHLRQHESSKVKNPHALYGLLKFLPKRLPQISPNSSKAKKNKHPYYRYLLSGGDMTMFNSDRVNKITDFKNRRK